MRHTRRRAALPQLKDLACHSPGVRSSQLHEAAGPDCFTAPYLAFFMIYNRKDSTRLSLQHTPSYALGLLVDMQISFALAIVIAK